MKDKIKIEFDLMSDSKKEMAYIVMYNILDHHPEPVMVFKNKESAERAITAGGANPKWFSIREYELK
jgi:hypothetical protein